MTHGKQQIARYQKFSMWLRKNWGKGTEDATENLTACSQNFQKGLGPESLALTTVVRF